MKILRITLTTCLLLSPQALLHAAAPGETEPLNQNTPGTANLPPFNSRELPAKGAEFEEALRTSMERIERDPGAMHAPARQAALEHLRHLAAPVPPEVLTALAVAQSDVDPNVRSLALSAIETLQLKLDVPALLLDGLSSDKAAVRVGAVTGIINLKLTPEQIKSKLVDALMKDDRFARNNVKRLFFAMGEPLRAAFIKEVQDRYSKSADPRVKVALLRALGIDSVSPLIGAVDGSTDYREVPMAEALPILGQALGDSSAEVRWAAMQTLRWMESPLSYVKRKKPVPNIFRDHPEQTAQFVASLKKISDIRSLNALSGGGGGLSRGNARGAGNDYRHSIGQGSLRAISRRARLMQF